MVDTPLPRPALTCRLLAVRSIPVGKPGVGPFAATAGDSRVLDAPDALFPISHGAPARDASLSTLPLLLLSSTSPVDSLS